MAITLNGEIVHSCDTDVDFQTLNTGANISGDDDIVEGAGAAGDKISAGTDELVVDAFEGATTTFDFSVGGTHEGWHGIGYVNTKTPINATTGIQAYARNSSGHFGYINAMPSYFYVGGFTTRVWNPQADFTAATTWTTGGNPAQLDDVTGFGFRFTTTTSIMGSFNNVQVDQFTFGLGVRADVGTSGTPNTYADVVSQDQDTSLWGWFSSFGAKGGLYIGPATGTTASWFVDSAFTIRFLDENVAPGFYGLFIRGANTTCDFNLASISAENSANSRWTLELDSAMGSTTGGFTDTNGVYSGSDVITLNQYATMTGTTFIDGTQLIQNNATLDGITVLTANTEAGTAYIISDNLQDISGSSFTASTTGSPAGGHAIEITTPGTYSFSNNDFVGYGADGSDNAAIYNSSEGLVTLAVTGGSGLTVKNKGGSPASTTVVTNAVTIRVQGVSEGAAIKVLANETVGTITTGDILLEAQADSTGAAQNAAFNYEGAFDPSGLDVIARVRSSGLPIAAIQDDNGSFTDETEDANTVTGSPIPLINLLPAVPVVNEDRYLFGHAEMFNSVKPVINTAGTGGFTITWQYWNGAWVNLSGVVDDTSSFSVAGKNYVSWTMPGDWATTTINSQGPYYFVRAAYTAGTVTAVPDATKITLDVTKYLPFVQNNTITSSGLTVTASWVEDTIATF